MKKCECKDVFSEDEIKHLEEVLHGDLDGYFEEIKDYGDDLDFRRWKEVSNSILKKCKLNIWGEKYGCK